MYYNFKLSVCMYAIQSERKQFTNVERQSWNHQHAELSKTDAQYVPDDNRGSAATHSEAFLGSYRQ